MVSHVPTAALIIAILISHRAKNIPLGVSKNGAYTSQPPDNYCLPCLVRKMWLLTELLCRRKSLETCTRRLLLHTAALPFDV